MSLRGEINSQEVKNLEEPGAFLTRDVSGYTPKQISYTRNAFHRASRNRGFKIETVLLTNGKLMIIKL